MQLAVIRSETEFAGLADEWNELLTNCNCASHVPFLRHEYLTTWWRTLGGGEWSRGELYVVIARDVEGRLIGIAPLFFTENREGEPALMLLGSIEISDYLDVISRPENLPEFLEALLGYLSSDQAPPWHVLDWYNIPQCSPTLASLKAASEHFDLAYSNEPLQHCPYIPLPGDWEAYLAGIDKKQRHEIRRKMRRAEEYPTPVRWYIVEDESILDQEINDFLDMMAQDPDKGRFLTEVMRAQMWAAVKASFQAGWLQLAFITVDGEKAAGYLNFDYANHILVYNSGISLKYRELSPGWVLLGYLLKWANENKRESFDFMRGNEDYKYRFGAIDRFVVRAVVRR